ncbi:MAG: S-layer homology domain-containing protein [Cyanobacteria bacterium P01_G01_bin.38]
MNKVIFNLMVKTAALGMLVAIATSLIATIGTAPAPAQKADAELLTPADAPSAVDQMSQDLSKDDDDDDGGDDDDDDDGGGSGSSSTTTTTTTTVTNVRYTDISDNYWASTFIYRLTALDIAIGFPGGEFLPSNPLTKSQYASLISQAFNLEPVREVTSITGISRSYWAYTAIQKAYSMGFLDLGDGGFINPNDTMTKLDMFVMLARSLGYTEITSGESVETLLSVFTDAETIPTEYRVIIAALVERGIIVNYPTVSQLNLFEEVTRAEACSYVHQALVSMGQAESVSSEYIVDVLGTVTETTTESITETTVETSTETSSEGGDDDDDGGDDDDDDDDS